MLDRDEDILKAAEDWQKAGRGVALATVVETWGSAPRPAGSSLVINDEGTFLGSVSGGCVEGAVVTEAMDVIEATAERYHAQIIAQGQHWHIDTERHGLMFQDETGVVQLPRPNLPGDHQIENAGTAVAALRQLGFTNEV